MPPSQIHYLPLAWPFFSLLVGVFLVVLVLIQAKALHFAYTRLGISSGAALFLLFASLLGSYVNLPVAQLPEQQILSGQEISYFGMRYVVPAVVDRPGTIIAVNLGGALIPGLLSLYIVVKHRVWASALIATASVTLVCHLLAQPVPGVGIAIPTLVPAIAAVVSALIVSHRYPAAVAYVSGTLGTLIGADLLNLDRVQGLGAPIASIGGAGTFDAVFLTGILAVLFASISAGPEPRDNPR